MPLIDIAQRLATQIPALTHGAGMTILVSACAIVLGFALGATLLGLSQSAGRVIAAAIRVYVSFFRGTPLLVQLLMMFYLPTAAGMDLPPFVAAVLAMGLNSAAFQCEILRAGRDALPPGQLEAARVFGIGAHASFLHIELPQMLRAVWPAMVSEAIDVLKGSAIVSTIAVVELTRAGREVAASTYRPLESYVAVAVFYLVMTGVIQLLGHLIHRCLNIRPSSPRRHTS